jgi:hypothetical protein
MLSLASPAAAQPTFSDQTVGAGINHTTFMTSGMAGALHYPGAAIGDFNRDGWPDLFLLAGGGSSGRDKLYINNQNGTFTDQAMSWGVDLVHRGRAVAVGDYNKDGWPDMFVASGGDMSGADRGGAHMLYHNNGDGTFTDVAAAAGVTTTSMTWLVTTSPTFGDYDLDGDLDLFVPTWVPPLDVNDGNRLFQNNGDGTFTDVTDAAGISQVNMHGFAGKFADMDGDRYPELMITSDFGTSRYYVNNGDGTFTDETNSSGTGQDSNGMGHFVADMNGDGLLDWYVTSIFSDSTVDMQDGNHLYLNQGNHVYTDLPETFGAADGGVGWGTEALDCDHDGDLDIAETNGAPFGAEYINETSYLYENNGDETFTDVTVSAGITHNDDGKTLIIFDYDRDGDMDIVITSYNDPVVLLRNDLVHTASTNWLEIALDTSANSALAPDGCGSGITATTGSVSQYRYLDCGPSYCGQSQNIAHFGLNTATTVDTLTVTWPDGSTSVLNDVAANQIMTIAAPAGVPGAPGEASQGDVPADHMLADYDPASGDIDVIYTPGCEATSHTIYFGDLADVSTYGYSGAVCFIGDTGSATFDPGLDNAFFLVVGYDGAVEGPYGVYDGGFDRPEDTGTAGCDLPQDLSGSCDLP